jgi:hypothetical protein
VSLMPSGKKKITELIPSNWHHSFSVAGDRSYCCHKAQQVHPASASASRYTLSLVRSVFGDGEDNRHVDFVDRTAFLAAGGGHLHRAWQRHAQQLYPDFGNFHDDLFSFNFFGSPSQLTGADLKLTTAINE